MDLGHVEFFEELKPEYILQFLKRVDICQLNGDVVKTLLKKLNVSNEIELTLQKIKSKTVNYYIWKKWSQVFV